MEGIKSINLLNNYVVAPAFINGEPVFDKLEKIEFDLCVTISEKTSQGKNAGLNITILSGNFKDESNAKNEIINRIKFSVPFAPGALGIKKNHCK